MKNVLITGASKGIGASCARIFAEKGYNVVANYNKSEKSAINLYNELRDDNYNIEIFKADISKREEVKSMIDFTVRKFKTIDILINNAGVSQEKLFIDVTDEEFENIMNINLKGAFICSQEALKYMLPEKKGKIINISSMWGVVGASCEVHYSISKAGLIGMTKALAKELGPSNIQVNAIAPGVIETEMLKDYTKEELEVLKNETPLMTLGKPEDVARMTEFLASEGGNFITGQVVGVNGGFVI